MTDAAPPLPAIRPTSPGGGRQPIEGREGRTSLRELPWCGKINLRGDPNDARFLNAAAETLGMPLPLEANTTSAGGHGNGHGNDTIFWLGPDEWLLHCEIRRTETVMEQLARHLAPLHHAATEVSDYYTILELSGENAAAILARGCPLDLHERAFKATQCAQTRFGNAGVLLYKPNADSSFQIQVRWSFTEYVQDYLARVIDTL